MDNFKRYYSIKEIAELAGLHIEYVQKVVYRKKAINAPHILRKNKAIYFQADQLEEVLKQLKEYKYTHGKRKPDEIKTELNLKECAIIMNLKETTIQSRLTDNPQLKRLFANQKRPYRIKLENLIEFMAEIEKIGVQNKQAQKLHLEKIRPLALLAKNQKQRKEPRK